MQTELNDIEKLVYEHLSFVATTSVYKGELPTANIGRFLLEMDKILPRATVAAINDAVQAEIKLKGAQGISADQVVNGAMKLSKMAEDFGKSLETANKTIYNAIVNSAQLQTELGKKERNQQDILDHFNIDVGSKPLINDQAQNSKDQKLNI